MAAMTPDDDRATELKWAGLEELRAEQEKLYMNINEIKSKLLDITAIKFDDKVWTDLVSLKELAGILSEEEAKLCLDVDAFIISQLQLPALSSSHQVVSTYKHTTQSEAIIRLPFLGAGKMVSPCRVVFTPAGAYHEKGKQSAVFTNLKLQSTEISNCNIASSSRGQKDSELIASSSRVTVTPLGGQYDESKQPAVIKQFSDGSNMAPLFGGSVTPGRAFHDQGKLPALFSRLHLPDRQ